MKFATRLRLEAAKRDQKYKQLMVMIEDANNKGKRICHIEANFTTEIPHLPEILEAEGFDVETFWDEEVIGEQAHRFIERITVRW